MTREFDARADRFGRFYNEFQVGDTYRHWPGKTITESEDHLYCMLTMAGSPLHIDSHYARTQMPQGKNIVVGTYIYALLTGMSVSDISGKATVSLGVKELKHLLPVFHGDTIYASSKILDKRVSKSKIDQGIISVKTLGTNQNDQLICSFERTFLIPLNEVP